MLVAKLPPDQSAVRDMLACYLGAKPDELVLCRGSHGKPEPWWRDGTRAGIEFSTAHSKDLQLLAVSTDGPVGIDLEYVGRAPLTAGLIERCFTEREAVSIFSQAANRQHRTALQLWTAKEAYVKALGTGVSLPLKSFEIPMTRDGRIGSGGVEGGPCHARPYVVQEVALGIQYVGSLATTASEALY